MAGCICRCMRRRVFSEHSEVSADLPHTAHMRSLLCAALQSARTRSQGKAEPASCMAAGRGLGLLGWGWLSKQAGR